MPLFCHISHKLKRTPLAVGGTDVYVGGAFDHAGNVAASRIAKWDSVAHRWSALGSGVDGPVYAIAVDGGNVYVGGEFEHAGGVAVASLARWNETSRAWSAVGGELALPGHSPRVNAIAVASNGDVYVGGDFETAGGVTVNNIARWDGSSWHALGSGTGGDFVPVMAIAISGSDVYIGGFFDTVGGSPHPRVARWNGSAWSGLGGGVGGSLPPETAVFAIAISGSNIYVGGGFNEATDSTNGTQSVGNVAVWNGSTWSAMGGGVGVMVYTLAVGPDGLYVGGSFQTLADGSTSAKRLTRWDGSAWHSLGGSSVMGGNDGVDDAVTDLAFMGDQMYLGGKLVNSNDGRALNHIGYWDVGDDEWYALGNSVNGRVHALAVHGEDIYLGGAISPRPAV
jgi:hypothetical protein